MLRNECNASFEYESIADHADQQCERSENSAYYMQNLPSGKYGAEKLIFNINSI